MTRKKGRRPNPYIQVEGVEEKCGCGFPLAVQMRANRNMLDLPEGALFEAVAGVLAETIIPECLPQCADRRILRAAESSGLSNFDWANLLLERVGIKEDEPTLLIARMICPNARVMRDIGGGIISALLDAFLGRYKSPFGEGEGPAISITPPEIPHD